MKSIVVRSAVAGLRLPVVVLGLALRPVFLAFRLLVGLPLLVARSTLGALWFVASIPLIVAGYALGALVALRRLLLRGVWLVVQSTVLRWLRPWIVLLGALRLSWRIAAWFLRLVLR